MGAELRHGAVVRGRRLVVVVAASGLAALGLGCGPRVHLAASGGETVDVPAPAAAQARVVRVLLSTKAQRTVSVGGEWRMYASGGRSLVARGGGDRAWTVERAGRGRLRAVRADGQPSDARPGPFLVRPVDERAPLFWNGRRWRGDLVVVATDSGLLVVNQLGIEDYLRGVVPLEIGRRPDAERAAAEAQAVAARSYVYVRATGDPRRQWDVVGTVMDQVYGGRDVETPVTDLAVRATAGEVLWANGRVVSAPFHAVCGGTTALPGEVWRGVETEPHLARIEDVNPATGQAWCAPATRYRWTRSFQAAALEASLARWVRTQGSRGEAGRIRGVHVAATTPSGRVGTLAFDTDGGRVELRGNDIRFALRAPSGEILSSTYFTVEPTVGRDGRVVDLTLRGTGYGHGVGMCQWGAIGRAKAGHDYRGILGAYYPGATVQRVP